MDPEVVPRQLPASLERLTLEPCVQLGRFRLALEWAKSCPRLTLDVERPVEVLLSAGKLQLRAATALAVLAEPGRLFDQQPPVAGLRGDDRLDPTLGDHRVHLLAESRVGEQLDHVHQPAAGPGKAVLPLAGAVEAAHDRHLGGPEPQEPLAVVQHELDLGALARLATGGAGEDHVLHRLAAHRHRRLLAERPQDRVGDVRLARAVGADDHAHARTEFQPGPLGERLEALQRDRLEVHYCSSASSAAWAASCSASFLLRPVPRATSTPPIDAVISNVRSCGGPCSSTTS